MADSKALRDELEKAAASGRAARDAAFAEKQAAQQQQSQVPGVPGAPPPSAAPGGSLPGVLGKFVEANADAGQSFLDRFTFGGLPALEGKIQSALGFKGPTPQEQAAAAEKRSPVATTVGAAGADAAQYALTRGALGAAGAPGWLARFTGGALPVELNAEVQRLLGNQAPSEQATTTEALIKGAIPALAPGVGAVAQRAAPYLPYAARFMFPGLSTALRHLSPGVAEALGVGGTALETETRRTGSNEREDDARRNARRRDR